MIGNFDEEGRTDAAKCPIDVRHQQYVIATAINSDDFNLVSTDKIPVAVDEAGSSKDRDIHDLLNGNLNILKLQLPTSVTMRKKGRL
uniref:Uncharacterized protein n=1 Tax=Bursaphelenchus xylophilus TaxID=6326 RepID=A0A1I7RLC2_BURXY